MIKLSLKDWILVIVACLILNGCQDSGDFICIRNNAQYNIAIFSIMSWYDYPQYPDTSFAVEALHCMKNTVDGCVEPGEKGYYFEKYKCRRGSEIRNRYREFKTDTVCFFVFATDTLNAYSDEEVTEKYKVLQRYDLSLDDALFFSDDKDLTFPPSEDMKHIKMWPPYGTYDKRGKKKATRLGF